jgi:hypothetical protein
MLGMLLIVKSGKSLLGIYFLLWGVLGRSCRGRDHMVVGFYFVVYLFFFFFLFRQCLILFVVYQSIILYS